MKKLIVFSLLLFLPINAAEIERNYSVVVMDAGSGDVLYEKDAEGFRFPASLTKMMTAYLAFDAIKNKKISLKKEVKISAKAARAQKTKFGFRRDEKVKFEDLVTTLLIISANDSAMAISEELAGSEWRFSMEMNKMAKKLGMNGTHFMNSTGLHNPRQFTTGKDMAILAKRLMEDFPEFVHLFGLREAKIRGRNLKTTNRLLGMREELTGFKTGFVNASGFNLVATEARDGKAIIAVLLNINNKETRDSVMLKILDYGFKKGSAI